MPVLTSLGYILQLGYRRPHAADRFSRFEEVPSADRPQRHKSTKRPPLKSRFFPFVSRIIGDNNIFDKYDTLPITSDSDSVKRRPEGI